MTHYDKIHDTITIRSFYENIKLNRSNCASIIHLKTGFGKYSAHLYKININNNTICIYDKRIGTLDYKIFGCIKNKVPTEILIKNFIKNGIQLPTNIVTLLISNL